MRLWSIFIDISASSEDYFFKRRVGSQGSVPVYGVESVQNCYYVQNADNIDPETCTKPFYNGLVRLEDVCGYGFTKIEER